MDILGVRVDNLKKKEIFEKVENFLKSDSFHQIATVNAEFILAAQKDDEFRRILNGCDLNIADTISIKYAFWRYGRNLKCRIPGINLMLEILKIANEKKLKIFLAAKGGGLSTWEETSLAIKKIYSDIEIAGENINPDLSESQNYDLRFMNYDIIFCSFGAPMQEKFIHSLKNINGGKIKLAMGVGGSFDYLTGKLTRAPRWMQKIGIEWLWRLVLQPKRFMRILNAVVIFPIKIIFNK